MDLIILFLVIFPAIAMIALATGDLISKIREIEKKKRNGAVGELHCFIYKLVPHTMRGFCCVLLFK